MTEQTKPGYLFQASIQIGERIGLTVSGNLPIGAEPKEIETELDRIFNAMEKQDLKRFKLPLLRGKLDEQKDAYVRAKKMTEELSFQEQGRKLTSAEKSQFETSSKQVDFLKDAIEKGEEYIEELEKEAA